MGSRPRRDVALLLGWLLALSSPWACAERDAEVYCGVCRALVDEIDWAVKKMDPKKTIQVGSFRISPDGSQKPNEIPYARSETHLLELFETICSNMDDYALYVDPETQKRTYMRFAPRDTEKMGSVDFKNFKFDPENSKSLKFVSFVISLYKLSTLNYKNWYESSWKWEVLNVCINSWEIYTGPTLLL
ncbi:protein canopy homolog 1-like isoform X2 [Narcine bancroftii]|uniref:protein canopy homolog 1-like isoform X2 n=1 Tax=Narcine bancroftii TaxID=1343680 RepID=UPI003831CBAC